MDQRETIGWSLAEENALETEDGALVCVGKRECDDLRCLEEKYQVCARVNAP